ncbi:hypothetical protein D3C72_2060500 [compost metagenome]
MWRSSSPSTASAALEITLTSTCCSRTEPARTTSGAWPRSMSMSAAAALSLTATISIVSRTTSSISTGPSFSLGLRAKLRRCRLIAAMRSTRPEIRRMLSLASSARPRSISKAALSA